LVPQVVSGIYLRICLNNNPTSIAIKYIYLLLLVYHKIFNYLGIEEVGRLICLFQTMSKKGENWMLIFVWSFIFPKLAYFKNFIVTESNFIVPPHNF
jgi:hypothetical protein